MIWQEDKPLRWSTGGMRQCLLRGAAVQFFGSGEQNGSFTFRDKTVFVANSFNWNEGGYNNSQPFYLSSAGYGAYRNTFSPGVHLRSVRDDRRAGAPIRRLVLPG